MFLVEYLITEAGFGDYGGGMEQPGQPEGEGQEPEKIEHEDIKKLILYEQVKQIYQHLNSIQFDKVDEEFYSLLSFCQNIIEFFNSFQYPEAVRLVDNLVDGIEEKLGLKIPPRTPHEPPVDEFVDADQPVDPMQQGQPQPPQQAGGNPAQPPPQPNQQPKPQLNQG